MTSREGYVPTAEDLRTVRSELVLLDMNYPEFCSKHKIAISTFSVMITGHRPPNDKFTNVVYDFLSERDKL